MRRRAGALPAGQPRPVVGDHVPLRADPPRHNGRGRATQAYIHACMHACIQTYIHSCMHTYIHTFKQPNNQTYIHTSKHTCIHLHTFSLTMAGGVHTGACKPPRSPSSISPRPPTPWRSRCVFDALAYVMLLQV